MSELLPSPKIPNSNLPPILRVGISVIITLATGIVAGVLTNEISSLHGSLWQYIIHTWTTVWLTIFVTVQIAWQIFLERDNRSLRDQIKEFSDQDFMTAYINAACLPEVAKLFQKQIQEGKLDAFLEDFEKLKEALK